MSASSEWPPTGVVPCSANDKASFACAVPLRRAGSSHRALSYESVAKRWPVILTDIINACVENKTGDSEHERQGSKIINGIQELVRPWPSYRLLGPLIATAEVQHCARQAARVRRAQSAQCCA
jgi:hypothetical protein